MLDNRKPPLTPGDVVDLLKSIDLGGPDDVLEVFVKAGTLRELVTVWLRVASLLEGIEMNPGDHTDEEHCAVSILLTGECKHGRPDTHDTEPANAKPELPRHSELNIAAGSWCGRCGVRRPLLNSEEFDAAICPGVLQ